MNLVIAEELCRNLMSRHGLHKWNFKFDHAKVRFGACNYSRKTISISKHLSALNSEKKVLDTILHEIAHALVGVRNNHNKIWQEKVQQIGGSKKRCYLNTEIIMPKRKYTASCPNCGKKFQAQKKTKIACGECCKKYNNKKYSRKFRIVFVENSK